MKRGIFISIEGPDGSGKSTQIKNIQDFFEGKNFEVVFTREPGGTAIGPLQRIQGTQKFQLGETNLLVYYALRGSQSAACIRGDPSSIGGRQGCDL